jgi:hypothetical protein
MDNEQVSLQDEKIEELLTEFDVHRREIKKMITDLEVIKENVDRLIPTSLDARYIRYFEEKVKSITGLFNSLLEMRKEIAKSVKDEIEIRRKVTKAEGEIELEDMLDIRKMASKIDEFKKEKERLQNKRIKSTKKEKIEGVEIPGINESGGTIDE